MTEITFQKINLIYDFILKNYDNLNNEYNFEQTIDHDSKLFIKLCCDKSKYGYSKYITLMIVLSLFI